MIARYNTISILLGVPGLIMMIVGLTMIGKPGSVTTGQPVFDMGALLLIGGFGMYARAKGRSMAWALTGIMPIVGLVVMAMLEDRDGNRRG